MKKKVSQLSLSLVFSVFQRKCSFSLHTPSWPDVLWKSQMLLSSSRKTGTCCWVSLGLKYSSTSWVVACPSTFAWKATKLRRSTNSSSCSVGGAGGELLPGPPELSSSSSSALWLEGTLRWLRAFILANREEEESGAEFESLSATSPLKRAAEPGFFDTDFFTMAASWGEKQINVLVASQMKNNYHSYKLHLFIMTLWCYLAFAWSRDRLNWRRSQKRILLLSKPFPKWQNKGKKKLDIFVTSEISGAPTMQMFEPETVYLAGGGGGLL